MLHNESVNVWSHLIGVGLFIILLFWTIFALNPFSNYLNFSVNFPSTSTKTFTNTTSAGSSSMYADFEAYCAKMFNVSLSAYAEDAIEITNEEAF